MMTFITLGQRKNFEMQSATAAVRETLIIFNIFYQPDDILKTYGSKVQDTSFILK